MTIRNRLKKHVLIGFEGPRYSENHELRDFRTRDREELLECLEPVFVDFQRFDL